MRTEIAYASRELRRTYCAYAIKHARKRSVLSVSLRSATHATDSTCSGCTAKSAATITLRQNARVVR